MHDNQLARISAPCVALAWGSSLVACSEQDRDTEVQPRPPAADTGLALTDITAASGEDAAAAPVETPRAPAVPPRDESAQVEVHFEGRYLAADSSFEITRVDEIITGRAQSDLRTVEQAAYCEIALDQDRFFGTGQPDTVEIGSIPSSIRLDDECGVSLLGLTYSDFGGALCADVQITSFLRSVVLRDVYAEINFMNPPTGHTGFTAAEFEQFGLGTGAAPPPPDNNSPIDAFGLWYYGELRTIAEQPANARIVRWVFHRENDADIYFRGRVVAKFSESCNNRDDDCDGNVDEGAGCFPIGGFCTQNSDCTNNICIAGQCRPDACIDGVTNNGETDLDCGGPCGASCDFGDSCLSGADCQSAFCDTLLCSDGVDTDNDGRTDISDNCVDVPNPLQQNNDGDAFGDACDPDDDNDGFGDPADNCPFVANPTQANADGDSLGDACDECPTDSLNDNDGDLICGNVDNCPADANPDQIDSDADNLGDACDPDIDGDTINNAVDNCPLIANPLQENNDADSQGDLCDDDDDNDNTLDGLDNCPFLANSQEDIDGDSFGDACDACPADPNNDSGNDAVCGDVDNCPSVANTDQLNSDGVADGGDACDDDDDNDGLPDTGDNCPTVAGASQTDTDGDGQGDLCDEDDDNDFILDLLDNCPFILNPDQTNTDGLPDGGDACDADDDADAIPDTDDNCPLNPNPLQEDGDNDSLGDACDLDSDNDAVLDSSDNCPLTANPGQENTDGLNDGGDACDNDDDEDLVLDAVDNCRTIVNAGQEDLDGDLIGDACDNDIDGDTVPNEVDNCDFNINPLQENLDGDSEGDICDADDDGDGIEDLTDNCPVTSNNDQLNFDGDTLGDACDTDDDNDGSLDAADCAPLNNTIRPGATEITGDGIDQNCDGAEQDNDCDGATDEGVQQTFYRDIDNDGFGRAASGAVSACTPPAGYVVNQSDCNDNNSEIRPGATEVCDTADNDCDGLLNENAANAGNATLTQNSWSGSPGTRGVGACRDLIQTCNTSGVWVTTQAQVLPSAEVCDNADNNCNGSTDESVTRSCYSGPSGTAGVGLCRTGTQTCSAGTWGGCAGQVTPVGESCDNQDNNCNGAIDDGFNKTWYFDADGDGWGGGSTTSSCTWPGGGWRQTGIDCDDGNFRRTPGRGETCDGIDNNCDGFIQTVNRRGRIVEYHSGCASFANNSNDNDECFGESFGGVGYMMCHYHESFANARARCQERGMQLADINDAGENANVIGAFDGQDGQSWDDLWIGGIETGNTRWFRWERTGVEFWRNGNIGFYANWRSGEPSNDSGGGNNDCVSVRQSGYNWNDRSCGGSIEFICEW